MNPAVVPLSLAYEKRALGDDYEQPFEKSLAQLGWTYLRDKAPRLLDYVVGFQLLDRAEDDNERAIGVFGFKVGKLWIYVPIIYSDNGQLKGHDMMWIRNNDLFVPLKEKWINYLLGKQPRRLGEMDATPRSQLRIAAPSLLQLSLPPMLKGARSLPIPRDVQIPALPPETCAAWARPALGVLGWLKSASNGQIVRRQGLDTAALLSQRFDLLKQAKALADTYPACASVFGKYAASGSADDFFRACGEKILAKEASLSRSRAFGILDGEELVGSGEPNLLDPEPKRAGVASTTRVELVVLEELEGPRELAAQLLPDSDKKTLLERGYLISDGRSEDEKTKLVEPDWTVSSPSRSGVHDVVLRSGSTAPCLVILGALSPNGRTAKSALVVPLDEKDGQALWAEPRLVVTTAERSCDEATKLLDKFPAVSDDAELKDVVLVHPSACDGAAPIDYSVTLGDGAYNVTTRCHDAPAPSSEKFEGGRRHPWTPPYDQMGHDPLGAQGENLRLVDDREHARAMGGCLFVPRTYRRVPCHVATTSSSALPLGTEKDARRVLETKTASFKIWSDGDVLVSTPHWEQRLSPRQAHLWLVKNAGLSRRDAEGILAKTANHSALAKRYFLKRAASFMPPDPGRGAPPWPSPLQFNDPTMGPAVIEPSQAYLSSLPPAPSTSSRPALPPGLEAMNPGNEAMNLARMGAQSGDREVMDVGALGSLLRSIRSDTLTEKELPIGIKFMNAVGQLLLKLYWKPSAFASRYGEKDLPELEATLKNNFENASDLVLFLKEKTVDPFQLDASEMSLEQAGEEGS